MGELTEPVWLAARAMPGSHVIGRRVIENGWDNRVLLAEVDGEPWVFRFPRRPDVAPDIARESLLLTVLRGRLPVAVPHWRVETEVDGRIVIGYPALPGQPAGREPSGDGGFTLNLPAAVPITYARTLGAAIAAWHAIGRDELPSDVAAEPERNTWPADLHRLAEMVEVPPVVHHWWEQALGDDRLWPEPSVLVHGDLHLEHTFIDQSFAVVGIIDWTDARIGCPAADFVDQRHAFGAQFSDELIGSYLAAGGTVHHGLTEQIVARQSLRPAAAALFGLDHANPDITSMALQQISTQADRLLAGLPPV